MSEQLSAIYASIEFIEGHLKKDVTVADIALAAGYSLYHFIRIFNQVVRHTPYDYLIRRRLTEAAFDLVGTDSRIVEISLEYRFKNHETFSRAFKRMFDIQPSQWRENGSHYHPSLMPKLSPDYLAYITQAESSRAELVERDEIILLGLATQDREDRHQLWTNLQQALSGVELPEVSRNFYGVSSQLQIPKGIFFYFAGVEISQQGSYPPPLVIQTLPQGTYARFTHKGPSDQLALLMAYIQHTWLPKSDYRMALSIEIECYGSILGRESNSSREIEIYIPIEALT
jgi:AraC family transcriptional regulator